MLNLTTFIFKKSQTIFFQSLNYHAEPDPASSVYSTILIIPFGNSSINLCKAFDAGLQILDNIVSQSPDLYPVKFWHKKRLTKDS
ncbi:MAG: hypothetical protein C0403_01315 [Desulfobacterium sp.]|nr:hypothetical protein [Desulfobacterium sp.]